MASSNSSGYFFGNSVEKKEKRKPKKIIAREDNTFNPETTKVELIVDYGPKNSVLYGLPKNMLSSIRNVSPSAKYVHCRNGVFGFIFPKSDLEAMKQYLNHNGIPFLSNSKEEKTVEPNTFSSDFHKKELPKNYLIVSKNRFGNPQITGTDKILMNIDGALVLVGKQDEHSRYRGVDSIIPLTKEERYSYRYHDNIMVLDETNVDAICQRCPYYSRLFTRLIYEKGE